MLTVLIMRQKCRISQVSGSLCSIQMSAYAQGNINLVISVLQKFSAKYGDNSGEDDDDGDGSNNS